MSESASSFASSITTDPFFYSASSLVERFHKNEISPTQYLQDLFKHIEKHNPSLNAVTSLQKEYALARAKELEALDEDMKRTLPFYGVPIIIKENIQKKGFPVECASAILKGYRGQFDATVVELLERAGAILVATANMDEFAMGSSNEHSVHGSVKNPHDLTRVSGGSSGGSAAACAAGFSPITLGSDTGGSVREPAAFCGVFGFKPTYGRVSRSGLVAYASSFDQISPFTRTAKDLDAVLKIIGCEDARDATSLRGQYQGAAHVALDKTCRIGVPRKLFSGGGLESAVMSALDNMEAKLKQRGVVLVDMDLPWVEHVLGVYYIIASAEASSNLARFDGIRYGVRADESQDLSTLYSKSRAQGFGREVKRRIMLGTFALSASHFDAYYHRAQAIRSLMISGFTEVFEQVDYILTPTAPACAFPLGGQDPDPVKEYLFDIFTIPANLTGIPAVSVPVPVDSGALPIGIQFMAPAGQDERLVGLALALEREGLAITTPLS